VNTSWLLGTLIVYKLVLLGIGYWASRRSGSEADYLLGGRNLGPVVTSISSVASVASAWVMLALSTAAYRLGMEVFWIFPGTLIGFCINWWWLAPRLRERSEEVGALTVVDVLTSGIPKRNQTWLRALAVLAILVSFVFYVAAQLQASGVTFHKNFDLDMASSVVIGTAIVLAYTLMGGFWAASVTDTLQGLMMLLAATVLPAMAIMAAGGPAEVIAGAGGWHAVFGEGGSLLFTFGLVAGLMGIGLGALGQPHVLNRYMAVRSHEALVQARIIALIWTVLTYGGMILLGWSVKAMVAQGDWSDGAFGEGVLFVVAEKLLHPIAAGVVVAAVLAAIMSTADSQLLVASSAISHDLRAKKLGRWMSHRFTLLWVGSAACMLALWLPDSIFSRVMFAWAALGAAFGPLLVALLAGCRPGVGTRIAAMGVGFFGTVILNALPDGPGDVHERLWPFLGACLILWFDHKWRGIVPSE
jgi:sodium/proline symporter